MNKRQVFAVMTKAVDDAFPTPAEDSSSQAENRDRPRHARTVPSAPNPAPGKDQKAKQCLPTLSLVRQEPSDFEVSASRMQSLSCPLHAFV
ncbi:hypothetical protein HYC85_029460 [Camellia sinensis]|uniref:Uncharacterized protein n=1 Tax=Camellia sinensis TaxID=4442 RepID=A0A7J7FY97_CAMSI|nr:hypothetical protein HYC85_029460 [Camellia sinensis]